MKLCVVRAKGCGDVIYPATSEVQGTWEISQPSLIFDLGTAISADNLIINTDQLSIGSNVYTYFHVPPPRYDVIRAKDRISFHKEEDTELTRKSDL